MHCGSAPEVLTASIGVWWRASSAPAAQCGAEASPQLWRGVAMAARNRCRKRGRRYQIHIKDTTKPAHSHFINTLTSLLIDMTNKESNLGFRQF